RQQLLLRPQSRRRLLVATLDLLAQLLAVCLDFVAFRDDDARLLRKGNVVEERRGSVLEILGFGPQARGQHVLQRNDGNLVDCRRRALGRGIVSPHRLDRVADELESNRLRLTRGIYVENAASKRELAVFVSGILPTETGIDEQLSQFGGRHLASWFEFYRCT